ncbi:hypothetical protein BDR07DRAFT_1498030 [Suillus spraguei]|nr:hypothetical protein BDR07DRAFT_1498030 [Suillus spraguei]
MPKQKLCNVANLGIWAKSLGHSEDKENSPPRIDVSTPSSPKKKKQKRAKVTTVLLDPPPFVLSIPECSPLCENNSFASMTNSPRLEENSLESEPKHPSRIDIAMGFYKPSPTVKEACLAFDDIKRILRPPKKTAGYKDPEFDTVFHHQLKGMKQFLWAYVDPQSLAYGKWTMASLLTAKAVEWKPAHSRVLCE